MLVDGIQEVSNALHERRQCEGCYQGYQSYKYRILNHFLPAYITKKLGKALFPEQLHLLWPREPGMHGFCTACHHCNNILGSVAEVLQWEKSWELDTFGVKKQ